MPENLKIGRPMLDWTVKSLPCFDSINKLDCDFLHLAAFIILFAP